MDQQRLDAIRARCEAATPGEWRAYEERFEPCGVELQIYDTNGWAKDLDPIAVLDLHCGQTDNAAFIAHAREDIPYLLDEVERLTAELAAMTAERDALKTELECAELRIKKLDRLLEFEEGDTHK